MSIAIECDRQRLCHHDLRQVLQEVPQFGVLRTTQATSEREMCSMPRPMGTRTVAFSASDLRALFCGHPAMLFEDLRAPVRALFQHMHALIHHSIAAGLFEHFLRAVELLWTDSFVHPPGEWRRPRIHCGIGHVARQRMVTGERYRPCPPFPPSCEGARSMRSSKDQMPSKPVAEH